MFYSQDTAEITRKASELSIYYIIMAFAAFFSSVLQFGGIAQVSERVSMRLRSDMFESIMRRDITFFDRDENATGALTTRLAEDSRTVSKASGEVDAKQLQAIFTLLIGLGIGLDACWQLSLVVIATFPINIAASAVSI